MAGLIRGGARRSLENGLMELVECDSSDSLDASKGGGRTLLLLVNLSQSVDSLHAYISSLFGSPCLLLCALALFRES